MATAPIDSLDKLVSDYQGVTTTYAGKAPSDPYPLLAELRAAQPVMQGDYLRTYGVPSQADFLNSGRPIVSLFRYKDVHAVLRDPANWLSYILADGFGAAVDGMLFTGMDGEEHDKYLALIHKPFLRSEVRRLIDKLIVPLIRSEFVDKLRPLGKADLIRDFSLPFPLRVAYAFLGFPDDPLLVRQLASWALQVLGGPQVDPAVAAITGPASMEAGMKMHEAVFKVVSEARATAATRDDVIGFMMRVEFDGRGFTDHEITSFVRMLLLAAGETTSRAFANMMVQLLERPDVLDEVRQNRGLLAKAVMETMRRDPTAAALARVAGRDMEIGGISIPKGTAVSLSIASANRDPDSYERPDELWLQRPMRPLLSFGFGAHICLGMHLAMAEMEVALDALLDLPNLRLDPAYPAPVIRGLNLRGPDAIHVLWDVK